MRESPALVKQILDTCLNVKKNEKVWIQTWDHTVDFASEIAFECQARGAYPIVTITSEESWMRALVESPIQVLENLPSSQSALLQQTDAFIFMLGPKTPINWQQIPEEKQGLADVWYLGSSKYMEQWRRIAKENSTRMLGVEYCLATEERAHTLGINLQEWKAVMLKGCLADQNEIAKNCEKIAQKIEQGHEVTIQTSLGSSLRLRLLGRKVNKGDSVVSSKDAANGVVKFLPSGFVEIAADEDSLEGTAIFDAPIITGNGRVEKLVLEFKHGKITRYHAQSGIDCFKRYLNSGQGDLDKFAFFGIGLNPGLRHGFTQDDKVLGGVTVGVGGNEDKGGKNRTAGNNHWWASMPQATVKVDNVPLVENGRVV